MKNITKYLIGMLLIFSVACDSDESIIDEPDTDDPTVVDPGNTDEPDPEDDGYVAPTYPDDYTAIADWSMRSQWNLANVHDPTVEKSGIYYYMYGTDASYGNAHDGYGHFPYRRSKDLVNWDFRGMAMADVPAWVADTLNNMRRHEGLPVIHPDDIRYGFWAPVVRKVGNKFRMYYSIVIDNYIGSGNPTGGGFENSWTERAFIGMMETDMDLSWNMWEDKGMVVCSVSDKPGRWQRTDENDWEGYFYINAIDPSFIEDKDGKHWLIYGSWHSGIGIVELDPTTGKPYNFDPYEYDPTNIKRIATRSAASRWQGSEAPEIIYNEETGYYYLFLAYDELSVAYNTRVVRSKNIIGPYLGINGTNVTAGGEAWPILTHPYQFTDHYGWVGISHNCVFQDDEGNWYYSSQARLPADIPGINASNAVMMGFVNQMRWTSDGWPVVMPERYAAVPDNEPIADSELVGEWEVITLRWSFQNMLTPTSLILHADGTATGALSGEWDYDADSKTLYIGNQELLVERGLDWEATPRVQTIIFSGLNNGDGRYSLWGKQK